MEYKDFRVNARTDERGVQTQTGTYDCMVAHPALGWLPYTVNPSDRAPVNVALLDAFVRHGLIEEWRNADES